MQGEKNTISPPRKALTRETSSMGAVQTSLIGFHIQTIVYEAIASTGAFMAFRSAVISGLAWAALGALAGLPAAAAELLMVEQPGCHWCAQWIDEEGQELGRIEGYPGAHFFWPMLNQLLDAHPEATVPDS